MKPKIILPFALALALCGCAYPAPRDKSHWYATTEYVQGKWGNPSKEYIEINTNERLPLLGPDGPGGIRRVLFYFGELEGTGPIYRDPLFGNAAAYRDQWPRQYGTITLDAKHKKVIINLDQAISKPGEPLKTIPCPANGIYPYKENWKDRLTSSTEDPDTR